MRLPGFEPGSRNWQSRILTKLYYNRLNDLENSSLLKRTVDDTIFNNAISRQNMDKRLEEKINQKINELEENIQEIHKIINSLETLRTNSNSFAYGIVIGRLYNSFYYQCRRILKRSPTNEEFLEFLDTLNKNQVKILDTLKLSSSSF